MTMSDGNVAQTDDGLYKVSAPIGGITPDEVTIRDGETTYRFHDFAGTASTSKVHPDVLLYENLAVVRE
jgi:hypothetical protein